MSRQSQQLKDITADLQLIKEAVSRSDNLLRFIDTGGALRGILLATGALIAVFSGISYYLVQHYGHFAAIPPNLRLVFYLLIALSTAAVGYQKIRNILCRARHVQQDMTLSQLFEELYTPRILALTVPNLAATILVIVLLVRMDAGMYIVPSLALMYGQLIIPLNLLLSVRAYYVLGIWLMATGLLGLYTATILHPMITLNLTFSAGFVLTALSLYLDIPEAER